MFTMIKDLDIVLQFMSCIFVARSCSCWACLDSLSGNSTHDCQQDLSFEIDDIFEEVKHGIEKEITIKNPDFPGFENLEKAIMDLLGRSFRSEIKFKLINYERWYVDDSYRNN
jgi:hypothetical protein